jgi:hypothetical protein
VAKEVKSAGGEIEAALRRAVREEAAQLRAAAAEVQHARRATLGAAIAAIAAVCVLAGALLASWFLAGDRSSHVMKFRTVIASMTASPGCR